MDDQYDTKSDRTRYERDTNDEGIGPDDTVEWIDPHTQRRGYYSIGVRFVVKRVKAVPPLTLRPHEQGPGIAARTFKPVVDTAHWVDPLDLIADDT